MKKQSKFLETHFKFSGLGLSGQTEQGARKPKLIVGIVVDQMRWDYLHRFYSRFSEGGFRRLMAEGFSCENTKLNYIPAVTSVGHSAIFTGSVPAVSGIAGNSFYVNGKKVYCTEDETVSPVGSNSTEGCMSPRNLMVTTIGDELKLSDNFTSKVIGISLKDRSSILPAGHSADAAYWFDDQTGRFITSSFYRDKLPQWVDNFNARDLAGSLMESLWNTLFPIDSYSECTPENPSEAVSVNGEKLQFPIEISKLFESQGYGVIRTTPYGNTLVLEMAKAALAGEKLGQEDRTDMLTVSLSSTDYIGHQFGTYSIELADTYYRLDRDLSHFISFLDYKVGRENYILFLTADHAAAHNYAFMQQHRMPAQGWPVSDTLYYLNHYLKSRFSVNSSLVKDIIHYQVYLDKKIIQKEELDYNEVKKETRMFLGDISEFAWVLDMENMNTVTVPEPIWERIVNGYHRQRSGELQIIMNPGCYRISLNKGNGGTEHGVWNSYDAHIPLLFLGGKIEAGCTYEPVHITDIAPTICAVLQIQEPSGCIGKIIQPLMENMK